MSSEKSYCLRGRDFDNLLLETIDDVLEQVFGEELAKFLLQHVKKSVSLQWQRDSERFEAFAGALQGVLGSSSAVIENLILKGLYSKLGLEIEKREDYGFSDYIKELKRGVVVEVNPSSTNP